MEFSPGANKEKFAKGFGFLSFLKVDLPNVRSSCMCWKQSGDELGREDTVYIQLFKAT